MTYKDLEQFLNSNNMTAMEFSKKTGISPQILTNAKKRGGHFSGSTVAKIHNAISFKDSASSENLFSLKETLELQQLLSISEPNIDFSVEEIGIIENFRNADNETRDLVVRMLAYAVKMRDIL